MSEDKSQDKTEQATPKRLQDAKEKGQVARSRDLNTMVILMTAGVGFLIFGQFIITNISQLSRNAFSVTKQQLAENNFLIDILVTTLLSVIKMMAPLFILLVIAALLGPILLGGWSMSAKALKPQIGRLNPLKGLKKIFAVRALVELVKTLLKFTVVASVAILIISAELPHLLRLGQQAPIAAMADGLSIICWAFLGISSALIIITAVDVPYQLWEHYRKLKMTKQEVKDEYKDTEGKPEVKGHIRRMQQEIAERRMMEEVPKADVIIMNPTHYAVALRYDDTGQFAPRVVAKGKDLIAQTIRQLAQKHNVPILTAAPLARSLFFSTKLNHEIPRGLYVAVAQVLAYVYQLKNYKNGKQKKPQLLKDFPIPDDLYKE